MPADAPPAVPFALDPEAQRAIARMQARNPEADPLAILPDVHPTRIPRHVAIIMDGNGRWAKQRGFPREFGHRNGARSVREIVTECGRLGVEYITLYSFSMENWKRPKDEVEALMALCLTYLAAEEQEMLRKGIRFRVIGSREGLPAEVRDAITRVEATTQANTRATLCLAINYSSRAEITAAAASLVKDAIAGTIKAEDVTEALVASRLSTAGVPDPDLLIRTAGEMRVSNFLLWQISYSELYVSPALWPDFGAKDLHEAVRAFARRERRFGDVAETKPQVRPADA